MYNLPPWILMKRDYLMLSLLIHDPKKLGNDINIFIQPFFDYLNKLWIKEVETYDTFHKNTFNMRSIMMWFIHDFPAYGSISGWMGKGFLACPICGKNTCL